MTQSIRIEHELEIQRPRGEVFAFVSDHDHLPAWTQGVSRAKRTTPGPVGVGATYTVVGRTLGRRVESTYELTEFEPTTRFSGRLESRMFSIVDTYVFEGDGDTTTIRITADATPGRALRLLGPLLGVAVERQLKVDHQRLKTILERKRRRPSPTLRPKPKPKSANADADAVDVTEG